MKIPKLESEETIKNWYQYMKPIVRDTTSHPFFLHQLSEKELMTASYTWLLEEKDFQKEVNFHELSVLSDIKVLISFDENKNFLPTVREIISQTPLYLRSKSAAFEVIWWPKVQADWYLYPEEFENGFFVCIVRLYSSRKGKENI